MIVIDRLKSPKQGISSMFVLNTEGKQRVDSKLLNDQELEYINREYSDNNRTFFAFDKLSHWEIVAVVENKDAEYKTIESLRRLGGKVLDFCDKEYIKQLQLITSIPKSHIMGFIEGMLLSSYTFDAYKTDPQKCIHPFDKLSVISQEIESSDIESLLIVARAVEKCKDLVNEPYCSLNAEGLASAFVNMSHEAGIEVEVWHKDKIEAEKMGGLLAVNKGSVDPPTFTIMKYMPKDAVNSRPLVLFANGLVDETGGGGGRDGD